MNIITGKKLQDYFLNRVEKTQQNNFYIVVKPIFAFKQVFTKNCALSIANLIIFPGSVIYNPNIPGYGGTNDRKIRADKVYVYNIVSKRHQNQCEIGVSSFDSSFKYTPNTFVTPRYPFSYEDNCCKSGIHFFLNLQDALDY